MGENNAPEIWGPKLWAKIDKLAREYPKNASEYDVEITFTKLWKIVNSIPCDYCKGHAITYILNENNKVDLRSKNTFQKWVWTFHDSVNQRRKKSGYKTKEINYKQYLVMQHMLEVKKKP